MDSNGGQGSAKTTIQDTTENPGEYLLPHPAQEQENERLNLQHLVFKQALDGALGWAPVGSPAHVLDVATGTGKWAKEFAKEHAGACVIGTELTEINDPSPVPNCTLMAADAEAESWPFRHKFDYIHLRLTISCFHDRKKVFGNCFANLNPGGWIELQDTHFSVLSDDGTSSGTALETWCAEMVKGAAVAGRNLHDTAKYAQMLKDVGFVNVSEKQVKVPWSPWSSDPKLKELGRLQSLNSHHGGRGVSAKILAAAGLRPAEIEDLLLRVKADFADPNVHAYTPLYVVYGQKPE